MECLTDFSVARIVTMNFFGPTRTLLIKTQNRSMKKWERRVKSGNFDSLLCILFHSIITHSAEMVNDSI